MHPAVRTGGEFPLDDMSNLKFTTILIAYNQESTVESAARSVLHALGAGDELLCVDDGSTDETVPILESIAETEPRLRLLRRVHSGKPSMMRNAGLDAATGDWVSFIDGDDLYDADRFAAIRAAIIERETEPDVVFHNHKVFDDGTPCTDGEPRIGSSLELEAFAAAAENVLVRRGDPLDDEHWRMDGNRLGVFLVARRFLLHTSSICVRRQLLLDRGIRFHEDRVFGEDHPFMLACVVGSRITYVRRNLSYYRKHARSLTATPDPVAHREQLRSLHEQVGMLERVTPAMVTPLARSAMRGHLLAETLHQGYLLERTGRQFHAIVVYVRAGAGFRSLWAWLRAAKALIRRAS